jgi:hypothetical protein
MRRWGSEMNTDYLLSKIGMWDWNCPSFNENGSYTYFNILTLFLISVKNEWW